MSIHLGVKHLQVRRCQLLKIKTAHASKQHHQHPELVGMKLTTCKTENSENTVSECTLHRAYTLPVMITQHAQHDYEAIERVLKDYLLENEGTAHDIHEACMHRLRSQLVDHHNCRH